MLWQQATGDRQNSRRKPCFGVHLTEEKLNDFHNEQIGQLQELMQEATKPNKQFHISDDSEYKNQIFLNALKSILELPFSIGMEHYDEE